MKIDDLFTTSEVDVRKLQTQALVPRSGLFKDAKVFNDACVADGYDMMIDFEHGEGFKHSREKRKYIKNFIGRFENYLDVLYPEHSVKFTINDPRKDFEVIWWIKRPERFKDFLKLLRYIDRYIQSYWGSWTNTGVQVVTASNRNQLRNLRVLIPPLGRMFEFKTLDDLYGQVRYNINNNFTLFWNNLNQQQELFSNAYYGNDVDSVDAFIRIFTEFAVREIKIIVNRTTKELPKLVDYNELREIIRNCLTEKFRQ